MPRAAAASLDRQPGEVPQFDQAGRRRVLGASGPAPRPGRGVVVRGLVRGEPAASSRSSRSPPAAVLAGRLRRACVDEDAAHGLGRGGEEVAAAVPAGCVGRADQPEVGLVDEGGRLEGVAGGLPVEPGGGEVPELVVDEREQFGGGLRGRRPRRRRAGG